MWRSDVMGSGGGRGNSYPGTIMSGNSAPTAAPDSLHAGFDPARSSSSLQSLKLSSADSNCHGGKGEAKTNTQSPGASQVRRA